MGGGFASVILRPTLSDVKQMRLPQEPVEHIIDCLSDDPQTLETYSLVTARRRGWLVDLDITSSTASP